MSEEIKEIEQLTKDIDEEISSLYDIQTVLRSIKVLLTYQATGKPYGEDEFY